MRLWIGDRCCFTLWFNAAQTIEWWGCVEACGGVVRLWNARREGVWVKKLKLSRCGSVLGCNGAAGGGEGCREVISPPSCANLESRDGEWGSMVGGGGCAYLLTWHPSCFSFPSLPTPLLSPPTPNPPCSPLVGWVNLDLGWFHACSGWETHQFKVFGGVSNSNHFRSQFWLSL